MKNITIWHFEEIVKKGYSLDQIFLLEAIDKQIDISTICSDSVKINTLYLSLIRKGLLIETGDKLTTLGKELLVFIDTKQQRKIDKKKPSDTDFETWWKSYPGTDTFVHKGVKFAGCRTLRQNKDECKLKFNKILLEGEYTAADLIASLEFDVLQKKESSVKNKTNKLTYMQNSLTYLNQRSFEPFIELIKQGNSVEEAHVPQGSTDI